MGSDFEPGTGPGPTVLCPQGHINSWAYKFCGQCGSPIGVVAWPEENVIPAVKGPSSKTRAWVVSGAIVLAVGVGIAAAVGLLVGNSAEDGEGPAGPGGFTTGNAAPAALTPPCELVPAVDAESVDMTVDGLTVDAAFMSGCAGGDSESGSSVRITVADGERDIAAGLFDFSEAPMVMEPGVVARRTLVFPAGTYWRTTDMFSGAPQLVLHPGEQSDRAEAGSSPGRLVAKAPAKPEHGSIDGVAEAVLKEIRDADYGYVADSIANRWVSQISSKKPGLVVDGKTLSSADVLQDHLDLRSQYGGARLVWSGQWSTFSSPDWWVTVVGPPRLAAGEANRWCDAEGFGIDDCFAKFVSSIFGAEGTTAYRK